MLFVEFLADFSWEGVKMGKTEEGCCLGVDLFPLFFFFPFFVPSFLSFLSFYLSFFFFFLLIY